MSLNLPDGTRRSRLNRTNGLTQTLTQKANQSYSPPTNKPDEPTDEAKLSLLQAYADKKKKQEWASWVEEQFVKCKNARANAERQWYINLAFVNGRHYITPVNIPGQGFRLTAIKNPPWRVKIIVNKIRVAVRTECAKLNSTKPIPVVLPASGEDEDYSAARVAEQILKAQFANSHFNAIYRSWLWWGVVCGVSYLKQYWNPNEPDDDLMQPAEPQLGAGGQPLRDLNTGEPLMKTQQPVMGKICIERITPFHLYVPDLLAETLEAQPYVIHAMTRTPEWVEQNFGFKPIPDVRASNTIMESAFLITKNNNATVFDSVLVKEIWIKPRTHKDFPQGGMLTVINSKVVQCKEKWPWPFKEFPFYKYEGIPTGGFYADSTVVDLIPLNKEYNRKKSQMIEIMNTIGKPKIMYPRGAINPRQITGEPGQMIPYTPGFQPPTELRGSEVPQSMQLELDRLISDFDDISGQHEISRGGTPAQVTSGTAIAFLQEQDDSKLNYQVNSIEAAVELLGKHHLKFVSTYWNNARLIKVVGKDENFEAIHWKGSDLRGNTDVRVQAGSGLPTSKAALRAFIGEYMSNGWIEPVAGLEVLDISALGKILDEILVDKRQAQRENLKLANLDPELLAQYTAQEADRAQTYAEVSDGVALDTGIRPYMPVNSWDNHQAHIMYHNTFRKTQEFELLPEPIKHEFDLHVQMHELAISQPAMGQLGPSNDPEAPVVDPETGTLMPNPLAGQMPLPGMEPPVGTDPNDLSGVAQALQMQRDEEKHNMDMHKTDVEIQLKRKLAEAQARDKANK